MKLHNRILSTLLAVLMMLGSLTGITFVTVSAATDSDGTIENTYLNTVYTKPEDKLATMTLKMEANGYQLYVDEVSGEVATLKVDTNEILFSNPYDVAADKGTTATTKKELLSQIVVQYTDNGAKYSLYSFDEAALRGQINVLNIKNGIRVEYTIGRSETRKLLPRWISETSFETYIKGPMEKARDELGTLSSFHYEKFMTYYSIRGREYAASKKELEGWLKAYPCIEKMNIYVFDSTVGDVKENWCESYIKDYCEDYTFEQMDADHEETGYVSESEKYPMFKMALEYSLDEDGMTVRMPCNGLRYDMTTYTLEYLSILPYMGAGNKTNEGYNFYPDGSGSLFSSDTDYATIRGKVYGVDYAYHNITNTYQKAIRYPVYGTVATETIYSYSYSYLNASQNPVVVNSVASSTYKNLEEIYEEIEACNGTLSGEIKENSYKRGYLAIIESGESLAEIASYHAGTFSDYYTMMNYFNPKPKDEYDISDSISVTSSSTWTVVSNRKYTGSFKLRYIMLSDAEKIQEAQSMGLDCKTYEASWLGMAEAYRDYLIANETLTRLDETDVKEDIPLYVEVFGALETQQTIATIPVNVMTPLTTFEDVYTMYQDFANAGVKNVNFKMTGFANGGMYSTVPSSLKWEKAVGGKEGFETLIQQAAQVAASDENANLGLYPDFDFAYIQENTLFDSVNLKRDAVKTIDNRYTSFRQYSATQQTYVSFHQLAVSPSRYSYFYTKLVKNYLKYNIRSMSVASLGSALNSDFDEDDPYNREDSKDYTIKAFQDLESVGYSLMTEGGNAYSWKYVDHIINMDLESSRHIKSMASVPFLGAVLHGYVQFAGTPLNEEGDIDYAILKAIESGASLYFVMSYRNTHELKEDTYLNKYYGIRYDIWQDDAIAYYQELNNLLKDVQTKLIVNHEFLVGERILDLNELESDLAEKLQAALDQAAEDQINVETGRLVEIADAWKSVADAERTVKSLYADLAEACENIDTAYNSVISLAGNVTTKSKNTLDAIKDALAAGNETSEIWDVFLVGIYLEELQNDIASIKSRAISAWGESVALEQRADAIRDAIEELQNARKVLVKAAEDGILNSDVKDLYLVELDKVYNDLRDEYLPKIDQLLQDVEDKGYTDRNSSNSIVKQAVNALSSIVNSTDPNADLLKKKCETILFTEEELYAEIDNTDFGNGSDNNQGSGNDSFEIEEKDYSNNRVVAVTYGDRYTEEGNTNPTKVAYKTFLLNYNSYSVRAVYDGVTYTIPSGGYVVIYHQ